MHAFSPCRQKQAFIRVRIKKEERHAFRFHWKGIQHSEVETRALFGLVPSPFLPVGVIPCHPEFWEACIPDLVAELRKSLYVNDLISQWKTNCERRRSAQTREPSASSRIDAKFALHKWHSNAAIVVESEPRMEDKARLTERKSLQSPWASVEQTRRLN